MDPSEQCLRVVRVRERTRIGAEISLERVLSCVQNATASSAKGEMLGDFTFDGRRKAALQVIANQMNG